MKAISRVKCAQDFRTTVIKISLFFILSKKRQGYIGFFCNSVAIFCVILRVRLSYISILIY